MYPCDLNSQECSWNTYTGSVASRSVTTKTYDCKRHDEKSDPLVASFCAICNAMCSRHKYCKLIKQAKSGDMQFMHVIIAVTDTTHATILYKKRGVNWIPLHIVQIRDFLELLHEYCKEKSETCTKF